MSALVVPSGECLRDEGLVWLIGAVVCLLAAYLGSNCSLAHAMDGRPHVALQPIGSCRLTATLMIVKHSWSGFTVRRAI